MNNFWMPSSIDEIQKTITSGMPIREALEYVIEQYASRKIFEGLIQYQSQLDALIDPAIAPLQPHTNMWTTMLNQLCNSFPAERIHDAFHSYIAHLRNTQECTTQDETHIGHQHKMLITVRRALEYDDLAQQLLPKNIYAIYAIGGPHLVLEHYKQADNIHIEPEEWTTQEPAA